MRKKRKREASVERWSLKSESHVRFIRAEQVSGVERFNTCRPLFLFFFFFLFRVFFLNRGPFTAPASRS